MATLNAWDISDANNNAAPPDGWPENTMQYSEVNNTGRAVQGTVKRFFADVNGSLQAGGVADAYTVTLNETGYTSYFQGMYFACEIMATNTGASTINVNGIGVQNIVARDGSALSPGALDSGGIYEFRYDGTDFQLMGTLSGGVVIAQATFSNSAAVDLVDTDVALRTGAADPDTGQHLEITLDEIQSKTNATTAGNLLLNPLGGNTTIYSGVLVGTLAGDPTAEDDNDTHLLFNETGGALTAEVGFPAGGDTTFQIVNRIWDSVIGMVIVDGSGVEQEVFSVDLGQGSLLSPENGGWEIEDHSGTVAIRTTDSGAEFRPFSGNSGMIEVISSDGSAEAILGLRNSGGNEGVILENDTTTGNTELAPTAPNGVPTGDLYMLMVPDGAVSLYHNGTARVATSSTGATVTGDEGLRIDHSGGSIGLTLTDPPEEWSVGIDSQDLVIRRVDNPEDIYVMTGAGASTEHRFKVDDDDAFYIVQEEAQIYGASGSDLPRFAWTRATGARMGYMQYDYGGGFAAELIIRAEVDSTDVVIEGNDGGSVLREMFRGNPDNLTTIRGDNGVRLELGPSAEAGIVCSTGDNVALYDNNIEVARTETASNGGFQVNNTLTGGGFERVLTQSDAGVNQTILVMNSFKTSIQSFTTTTLTDVINESFEATLRADSQGDDFRLEATLFLNNTVTTGNNPGMRIRIDTSVLESGTSNWGYFVNNFGTSSRFQSPLSLDSTVTALHVGRTDTTGPSQYRIHIGWQPTANSETIKLQLAQSTANAGQPSQILNGSSMQLYDYGT